MLATAPPIPPRPSWRRSTSSGRFCPVTSTASQFRQDDSSSSLFCGAYGHIRQEIDSSVSYQRQRQWLHDSIVEGYLHPSSYRKKSSKSRPTLPLRPWLIITVGVPGAGKRWVIEQLRREQRLELLSYIVVDPDEICRLLPEYASIVAANQSRVESVTRDECKYIAETLMRATLHRGGNVVRDYSSHPPSEEQLQIWRERFPALRIALLHVTAPWETVRDRIVRHSAETGKTITVSATEQALQAFPEALREIQGSVDYFCTIHNDDGQPLSIEHANHDNDGWQSFQETFRQKIALTDRLPGLHRLTTDEVQKSRSTQRRVRRRFSVLQSSEENHRAHDMTFHGQFAHIRCTLDYSYHSNYTFERQLFQDAIINEFLNETVIEDSEGQECTTPTEPWIVFTAGAMGAGKSYAMKTLVDRGHFPLLAFVRVDPDEIRRFLPEFHVYVADNPELAGELTRKEAGFITEILTLAGLQAGKNVLVDGSLRDDEWYKGYFSNLRRDFSNLRLSIIHVTAPRDVIRRRAAERAKVTGRVVPDVVLMLAYEQVPHSVAVLSPLVDYYVKLSNDQTVELVDPANETWATFRSNWAQTCAWLPHAALNQRGNDSWNEPIPEISVDAAPLGDAITELP